MDSLTYQIGLLNYKTSLITAWTSFIGLFIWPIAIFGILFLFRRQIRDLIPRVLEASIFGQSVKLEAKAIVVEKIQELATEAETQKEEVKEIEVQLSQPNTLDPAEKENLLKQISESNAQVRLLEIEKFRLEDMLNEGKPLDQKFLSASTPSHIRRVIELNPLRYKDIVSLIEHIGIDEVIKSDYHNLRLKIGEIMKQVFLPDSPIPISLEGAHRLRSLQVFNQDFIPTFRGTILIRKIATEMQRIKSNQQN